MGIYDSNSVIYCDQTLARQSRVTSPLEYNCRLPRGCMMCHQSRLGSYVVVCGAVKTDTNHFGNRCCNTTP